MSGAVGGAGVASYSERADGGLGTLVSDDGNAVAAELVARLSVSLPISSQRAPPPIRAAATGLSLAAATTLSTKLSCVLLIAPFPSLCPCPFRAGASFPAAQDCWSRGD